MEEKKGGLELDFYEFELYKYSSDSQIDCFIAKEQYNSIPLISGMYLFQRDFIPIYPKTIKIRLGWDITNTATFEDIYFKCLKKYEQNENNYLIDKNRNLLTWGIFRKKEVRKSYNKYISLLRIDDEKNRQCMDSSKAI